MEAVFAHGTNDVTTTPCQQSHADTPARTSQYTRDLQLKQIDAPETAPSFFYQTTRLHHGNQSFTLTNTQRYIQMAENGDTEMKELEATLRGKIKEI